MLIMKILVTGGLGYIGSHTILELSSLASSIHIIDNLSNSNISTLLMLKSALPHIEINFHKGDIIDYDFLSGVFSHHFQAVLHFAALKTINETQELKQKYIKNNIIGTFNILKLMQKFKVKKLVYSSSASVYDSCNHTCDEDSQLGPQSFYGKTKLVTEMVIKHFTRKNPECQITILRYFNPAGAHFSALIGEDSSGKSLFCKIQEAAKNKNKALQVFGNDYDSADGSAVRDFVHIEDIAKGNVKALEKLESGVRIYNLGSASGASVFEVIKEYEKVAGFKFKVEISQRRKGDAGILISNSDKAWKELGWRAEKTLEKICRDSWNYIKHNVD